MSDNLLHQHLYVHQSLQHWHRPGGLFGLTSHLFLFSYVMRCWHFRTEKCHQRKPHFMYRINRVDPQGSMNCNISHVGISTYNKIKYNTIKLDGGGGHHSDYDPSIRWISWISVRPVYCVAISVSCSFNTFGSKGRPVVSVTPSSRPNYRGQAVEYPSVAAPPLLRVKIEVKLCPEHRIIILSLFTAPKGEL